MKPKILIVDDESYLRKLLKQILEEQYDVVGEASDGDEVFDKYLELRPDIVLLDIMMPKKNGLVVLKEIRKYNIKAKVVMMTADADKSKTLQAIQNGACGFIAKPFSEDTLLEVLDKALKRA